MASYGFHLSATGEGSAAEPLTCRRIAALVCACASCSCGESSVSYVSISLAYTVGTAIKSVSASLFVRKPFPNESCVKLAKFYRCARPYRTQQLVDQSMNVVKGQHVKNAVVLGPLPRVDEIADLRFQ